MKNHLLLYLLFFVPLLLFGQTLEPNTPLVYPKLREADIMWQHRIWRVIDLREKMNQYLYYPFEETNGRISLFGIIRYGVENDLLTTYDPMYDDFSMRLNKQAAISIGTDTVTYEDNYPDPPYDTYTVTRIEHLDNSSVKKYLVKEDWIFDKARSVMEVRIIGICPVREVRNPDGSLRGEQMMYWIYFPELRNLLSQYPIYNRFNLAQPISYDDAFIKRMFSSYIYKEDNVFDRKISDYLAGLDAYLEGESIKEKMRLFESDLWEP